MFQPFIDAGEAIVSAGTRTYAAAQSRSLNETAHRPWRLPERPWLQGQTWIDLLFMHWPADPEILRPVIPADLPLDTFDGRAWIGITPFEIRGLRARGTIPPPRLSRFAETNARSYVTVDGKPGIWFLSLDAASHPAVVAARRLYRLPYFHASAGIGRIGDEIRYEIDRDSGDAGLALRFAPVGEAAPPAPGTLEHFLTERYCLYTVDEGLRFHRAEIHHPPWRLQSAEAQLVRNTILDPYGIALPEGSPLLHFSGRQDVVIWSLERV